MESLASLMPYAVFTAMGLVLAALALGIISMVRSSEFNAKHANKFMHMRVGFQALAVAILALSLLIQSTS